MEMVPEFSAYNGDIATEERFYDARGKFTLFIEELRKAAAVDKKNELEGLPISEAESQDLDERYKVKANASAVQFPDASTKLVDYSDTDADEED